MQTTIACTFLPVLNASQARGTLSSYIGPFNNCEIMYYINQGDTGTITVNIGFGDNNQNYTINPGTAQTINVPPNTPTIECSLQGG